MSKHITYPIIIIVLLSIPILAYAEESIILPQKDVPLEITYYKAVFEAESRKEYDRHLDQIKHTVNYKNVSEKEIVAVRLGIGAFNTFNEFMSKFGGYDISTIDIEQKVLRVWIQKPYATASFKKYGTGFVYVDAVRFSDGIIWHADIEKILEELRKFESDLEKEALEENRE